MPTYEFRDKSTGDVFSKMLKISELDDYKSNNPQHEQVISSAPKTIGGRTFSGGSLPEGFKDKLKDIKKKHPLSTGVDNLI